MNIEEKTYHGGVKWGKVVDAHVHRHLLAYDRC